MESHILNLQNVIHMRNLRETVACIFVMATFSWKAFRAQTRWARWMCFELVAACAFIVFVLYQYGSTADPACQIQLLSYVGLWYVIPLMIGILGLTFEKILRRRHAGQPIRYHVAYLILVFAMGIGVTYLNQMAANGLRQEFQKKSSDHFSGRSLWLKS